MQASVLHVYRTYFPDTTGGVEESILQIALAINGLGYSSKIYTLSKRPDPSRVDRAEGTLHRSRSWISPAHCDFGGLDAFTTFKRLVRDSDLIHYHFPWPFFDLLHLVIQPNIPAVVTYHSDIVRQDFLKRLYDPLMRKTFRAVQRVVTTSPNYAQSSKVLNDYVAPTKLRIIPHGIVDTAANNRNSSEHYKGLAIDPEEHFFLFLGVFRYYKGLHTLLKAATLLTTKIVLAGSGPEEASIAAEARKLGLTNIVFTGEVTEDQKATLLKNCLAFVLPSDLRSEAFGMVLVEAAMYGKPMISCEIGTGTSYVNINEETGFVIPPSDPAALAAAMRRLADSPPLAATLGRNARMRYERYFSGDALGRAYADLYTEVLEESKSTRRD